MRTSELLDQGGESGSKLDMLGGMARAGRVSSNAAMMAVNIFLYSRVVDVGKGWGVVGTGVAVIYPKAVWGNRLGYACGCSHIVSGGDMSGWKEFIDHVLDRGLPRFSAGTVGIGIGVPFHQGIFFTSAGRLEAAGRGMISLVLVG